MPFRLRVMSTTSGSDCASARSVAGAEAMGVPVDVTAYDFGVVLAAGGGYELCWCSGVDPVTGCTLDRHFNIRIGQLVLEGPAPPQGFGFTCAKNERSCLLGAEKDFPGEGLAAGDSILVSPECGEALDIFGVTQQDRTVLMSDALTADFADRLTPMEPGMYNLCWSQRSVF